MNRYILSVVGLFALTTSTACTSTLPVNDRQAATMSPQALDALKGLRMIRVPLITPSTGMLLEARKRLAKVDVSGGGSSRELLRVVSR